MTVPTILAALAVSLSNGRAHASVQLDPPSVLQGGFVVVRVPGASGRGSVEALGRFLPLFAVEGGLRALVPVPLTTDPGRKRLTVRAGGRDDDASFTVLRRASRPVEKIPSLRVDAERVASLRDNKGRLGAVLRGVSPAALWGGPLRRPVPGRVSAEYGALRSYGGGAGWPHRGVDFAVEAGWPVVAAAPGVVVLARRLESYGNVVVLDHGQTVFTSYLHLKAFQVSRGDRVGQGQVIGVVGATGMATGPHLHFGAHIAGVAVDPLEVLARGLP